MKNKLIDRTDLIWSKTKRSSGTAGSLLKAEEVKNGKKTYYKLSNFEVGKGVTGHECVNEIIVDRLLTLWGVTHLSYNLIHMKININGEETTSWVCSSEDLKKQGDCKLAMDTWYEMESLKGETPLQFCQRKGIDDYMYIMLAIDFIILNRDRHGANIELIKNRSEKSFRMAPLFDHGLSLILENDDQGINDYDITQSKKVQCFLGGNNPEENLRLVPVQKMPFFRELTESDKRFLFNGLDEAVSMAFIEKNWELINYRRELYENIRNQK